ncbi:ATP-binding protein [Prolixibacteraceae bacterium JC049]|nr:ATP-binding protein [Prolixibacteraceae bacterium JC049]
MSIYFKKRWWKFFLLIGAILIGAASMYVTNIMIDEVANAERKRVELWASAYKQLTRPDLEGVDINLATLIIQSNNNIPMIVLDNQKDTVVTKNIPKAITKSKDKFNRLIVKLQERSLPIQFVISEDETHSVFYDESTLLKRLKYFPYLQLAVIVVFILIAYYAFDASREAEQNQVWVGMSRETAHQLGTPISSLMAWIELLKLQGVDTSVITELSKDTSKLEMISKRFSKIGSKAELFPTDVVELLENTISYLQVRVSNKINFSLDHTPGISKFIPLNPTLFEWVVENICKNAVDAISGEGKIDILLSENTNNLIIDIADNGKGIPKSKQRTIFKPGYTTKSRGWGLGLSLAKRIVHHHHKGKLFVKSSEIKKGTTFRIIIPKNNHY